MPYFVAHQRVELGDVGRQIRAQPRPCPRPPRAAWHRRRRCSSVPGRRGADPRPCCRPHPTAPGLHSPAPPPASAVERADAGLRCLARVAAHLHDQDRAGIARRKTSGSAPARDSACVHSRMWRSISSQPHGPCRIAIRVARNASCTECEMRAEERAGAAAAENNPVQSRPRKTACPPNRRGAGRG